MKCFQILTIKNIWYYYIKIEKCNSSYILIKVYKMNSKIDYSTISDLADKNIISQNISFKNNSKIVETIYLNENNQEVKLKQTLMKKAVAERQKWAKFGAAKDQSNDGITTFGAEVNIEYVNKDSNKFVNYPIPIPKPNKFGMRKSIINNKQSNNDKDGRFLSQHKRNNHQDGNGRYLSQHKRNSYNNNNNHSGQRRERNNHNEFVVIVKNVPYGFNSYDLKDEGNKYGYVTRARVLDNKGIGFIHYKTQEEQENSIQNLHRTNKLGGHMLIHAEKAT